MSEAPPSTAGNRLTAPMSGHNLKMQASPFEKAGIFSRIFFRWPRHVLRKGYKHRIERSDIHRTPQQDQADTLSERLEREWDREISQSENRPHLLTAIRRCFLWRFVGLGVIMLLAEFTKVVQPFFLGQIIASFNPSTVDVQEPLLLALGLSACFVVRTLLLHPAVFGLQHLGMDVRIATFCLIYKKIMKLSSSVLDKITVGQLVSLLSNNLNKFDESLTQAHFIWIAPIQCVGLLAFLWRELGPFCLVGFAILLIVTLLQAWLGHKINSYRDKRGGKINERIALTSEVLENIEAIKVHGWEEAMGKLIDELRKQELKLTSRASYSRYFNSAAFFFSGVFVVFASILPYAVYNELTLRRVLTSVSFFNVLRMAITRSLPWSLQMWVDATASIRKIQDFLLLKEYRPLDYNLSTTEVEIVSITASWDQIDGIVPEQGSKVKNGIINVAATDLPFYKSYVLSDINFKLNKGEMLIVMGSFGSGKSSLLLLMLGELLPWDGRVRHSGRLSFSSQQPWIINASVQENITLGLHLDKALLWQVLRSCGLQEEIMNLPQKEKTLIGESGFNLSGGQRARISLARAVYREADLYLLDSPFSYLDVSTEKQVFESCIDGFLAKKTRILVTSKVEHLQRADKVLILNDGVVYFYGTFPELQKSKLEILSLILQAERFDSCSSDRRGSMITGVLRRGSTHSGDVATPPNTASVAEPPQGTQFPFQAQRFSVVSAGASVVVAIPTAGPHEPEDRRLSLIPDTEDGKQLLPAAGAGPLHASKRRKSVLHLMLGVSAGYENTRRMARIQQHAPHGDPFLLPSVVPQRPPRKSLTSVAEESDDVPEDDNIKDCFVDVDGEEGELASWTTYRRYFGSSTLFGIVLCLNLVLFAIQVMVYGVGLWNLRSQEDRVNTTRPENGTGGVHSFTDNYYYFYIYVGLADSFFVLDPIRGLLLIHSAIRVSDTLSRGMLRAILHAPASFFLEKQPGYIINRFSKDVAITDDQLPLAIFDYFQLFLIVLGAVTVVSAMIPWTMLVTLPLGISCMVLRHYFLRTFRQLKQMESEAKNPIFAHIVATLKGLWTIRAFSRDDYFENIFHQALDIHTATWFLYLSALRWFQMRIDIIFTLFITAVTFISVGVKGYSEGSIAIALTLAMNIMSTFQWAINTSIEVEGMMRSTERILRFMDIPEESSGFVVTPPPPDWPSAGHLEVVNLSMRHSPTAPYVLQNISFNVQQGQKMAILGRTGAGKSTLLACLLLQRDVEGEVRIDGLSARNVAPYTWRSAFQVITQKIFIFTGTLRKNLDPYGRCNDEEIWKAIDLAGLRDVVEALPGGLDVMLVEGGWVLSEGQKQLLSLVRCLLYKARILLLDEPTANLDQITAQTMMRIIRKEFKDCTILVSEHRIRAIYDCNQILVLEDGKVREYGTAQVVFKKSALFREFVPDTGSFRGHPVRSSMTLRHSIKHISLQEELAEDDIIQETRL
uniref:Cystic fibrosis transmembrane conductance regulator n=1 Tax=Petromyzon marinus TaxID=7757 RepID=A0A5Q0TXR8_PETMA|nr:cystic fibrosis transmembrane conductance regulator [Petromyzon marinus]QGA72813.1 CFTR [Petromyzon marinus]